MTARALAHFQRLARRPDIRLVSVDVFDTLLLRGTRPELHRFLDIARAQHHALGRVGLPSPGWQSLARARLRVHKECYDRARTSATGEPAHADILAGVAETCLLPATVLAVLAAAEIAYEHASVSLNRRLAALLQDLAHSRTVVFTSDMYLPESAIAALIAAHAPALAGYPLYVSSTIGKSKRRGDLFAHVAERHGVAPSACLHLGDHAVADGAMARRAGFAAIVAPRPLPWRLVARLRAFRVRSRLAGMGWLAP